MLDIGVRDLSVLPIRSGRFDLDDSLWPIRSCRFGLSRFGLAVSVTGLFGLGRFGFETFPSDYEILQKSYMLIF